MGGRRAGRARRAHEEYDNEQVSQLKNMELDVWMCISAGISPKEFLCPQYGKQRILQARWLS